MAFCAMLALAAARWLEVAGGWLLVAAAVAFGIHCAMIERRFVARADSLPAG
jgi:hypothetical protein